MAEALYRFDLPIRTAEIWGLNEDGTKRDPEDIAADLDFQDNAIEDYLNNIVPNIYISQAAIGDGVIDPAQLASGTPGAGKAPVGNPPAWTDIATQAELNAAETALEAAVDAVEDDLQTHSVTTNSIHGILFQRGTTAVSMSGTTTTRAVAFPIAYPSTPNLQLTPLVASDDQSMWANAITVTTGGFVFRATTPATTTNSATVFWSAMTGA